MCGIAGIVSRSEMRDASAAAAMRDQMLHRGPDDTGEWLSPDKRVALAHARLAVIDLSPAGHQPMADTSGRLRIVFNGEIFNYATLREALRGMGHSFGTSGDTEVLLEAYKAWGTRCLDRLNGMFSFALHDPDAGILFLARDRAGEKPLYYRKGPGLFAFASEIKGLMADPSFERRIDRESLEQFLTWGFVPGGRCLLKGVEKLPPGEAMTCSLATGELTRWRYWAPPEFSPGGSTDPRELKDEMERLLLDSVRMRLISDVPVGILLSGGIDSALVTAMASRVSGGNVQTFTVSFPGHGKLDEGPRARAIAAHFGTRHTELVAEPASVDILPMLARQFDDPIGNHSIVPTYLVTRLIRQHATVALGGDGGDELFGGYPHYGFLQRIERLRRIVPAPLRYLLSESASRLSPVGMRWRNHVIGLSGAMSRSIAHVNLYFNERSRMRLLSPLSGGRARRFPPPERLKEDACVPGRTVLQQAMRMDFGWTLADDYLVKMDRASMLVSLEVRSPFLDHRLVEFAFSRVPDELKSSGGQSKILSKRLLRRLLPEELKPGPKQGFELPLRKWFAGQWGDFMESVLGEADPGIFDRGTIRKLIDGQRQGYANENRLFLLIMFELWRREYRVSPPCGE